MNIDFNKKYYWIKNHWLIEFIVTEKFLDDYYKNEDSDDYLMEYKLKQTISESDPDYYKGFKNKMYVYELDRLFYSGSVFDCKNKAVNKYIRDRQNEVDDARENLNRTLDNLKHCKDKYKPI